MPDPQAAAKKSPLDDTPLPRYYQIATLIRNSIMDGKWPPNSRLPTEGELVAQYGVSRPTVRSAKKVLTKEGFIRSIKGSGCYVNNHETWKTQPPTVDNLNDIFHFGSKMIFKIHECGLISNSGFISQKLKTPQDKYVLQIKGVRWFKNRPLSHVTYYWPFQFGSRVSLERLDENPFIPQLEKMAGIKVVEGTQQISLARADREVAGHLELKEGDAILLVQTIYVDDQQRPVEYLETRYKEALPYSIRVKR